MLKKIGATYSLLLLLATPSFAGTGVVKATTFTVPEEGIVLKGNLLVSKDIIEINGPILTNGHNLKLIADEVRFNGEGAIYGYFNFDAPTSLMNCSAPITEQDPKGPLPSDKPSAPGGTGRGANDSQSAGNGAKGADGKKGYKGENGKSGKLITEPITIVASKVVGTAKIYSQGETAGNGGDGGKGSDGQRGQQGGPGWASCTFLSIFGEDRRPSGNGGPGGAGGAGGNGGKAGLGGTNPEVFVFTNEKFDIRDHDIYSLPGEHGLPGSPGKNGTHGDGGPAGKEGYDIDRIDLWVGSVTTCEVRSPKGSKGAKLTSEKDLIGYPAEYGNEIDEACWNVRGEEHAVESYSLDLNKEKDINKKLKSMNKYKRLFSLALASAMQLDDLQTDIILIQNGVSFPPNYSESILNGLKDAWKNLFEKRVKSSKINGQDKRNAIKVSQRIQAIFTEIELGNLAEASQSFNQLTNWLKAELLTEVKEVSNQCLNFKMSREEKIKSFLTKIKSQKNTDFVGCIEKNNDTVGLKKSLEEFQEKYIEKTAKEEDLKSISLIQFCDNFKAVNGSNPNAVLDFMQSDIALRKSSKNLKDGKFESISKCTTASLTNFNKTRFLASGDPFEVDLINNFAQRKLLSDLYTSNTPVKGDLVLDKLPGIKLKNIDMKKLREELLLTALMFGGYQ